MKPTFRLLFPSTAAALLLVLTFGLRAQDTPAPAEKTAPAAPTTPTTPAGDPAPAPAAAPAEPAATTEVEAPANEKKGLRRIDKPVEVRSGKRPGRRVESRGSGEFPFGDHVVPAGSRISEAVSIFGSSTVEGEVGSDSVSVFGNTTIGPEGKVGGAAVAVLGKLDSQGEIRGEAVSVLGGVTINGPVHGEAVAVLGNMHLGPKAVVNGDIVVVGGKLTKDPGAIVRGNQVNVPILGAFGDLEWFTTWLKRCLVFGRPLAFGAHLGWAWGIAGAFLAFYTLLGLLFGRGIEKCVETLETRPGATILASILAVFLTPVAVILLAVTIVGAVLVPFVGAGLFVAGLFGKAVMLAWIGRRVTRFFGDGPLGHPVFAVLVGGIIVMFLYTIWGSFLLYKLLSWVGFGVVVYTLALAMKREKSPLPAAAAPDAAAGSAGEPVAMPETAAAPGPASPAVTPAVVPLASAGFAGVSAPVSPEPGPSAAASGFVAAPYPPSITPDAPPPAPPVSAVPPPVAPPRASVPPVSPPPVSRPLTRGISPAAAIALPRAGFFPRLAAMALDGILVGMVVGFSSDLLPRILKFNHGPGGVLIALALYGAIMWKTRGTTIGGVVCGLKVVRLDQREIDWATALVRALGCFLSLAVAGLGFIWVAFDEEKQSWHDKIAGTTVVRVPRGVSLI